LTFRVRGSAAPRSRLILSRRTLAGSSSGSWGTSFPSKAIAHRLWALYGEEIKTLGEIIGKMR
jgi:hypothetical protein